MDRIRAPESQCEGELGSSTRDDVGESDRFDLGEQGAEHLESS